MTHKTITTGPSNGGACIAHYNHYVLDHKSGHHQSGHHQSGHHHSPNTYQPIPYHYTPVNPYNHFGFSSWSPIVPSYPSYYY